MQYIDFLSYEIFDARYYAVLQFEHFGLIVCCAFYGSCSLKSGIAVNLDHNGYDLLAVDLFHCAFGGLERRSLHCVGCVNIICFHSHAYRRNRAGEHRYCHNERHQARQEAI